MNLTTRAKGLPLVCLHSPQHLRRSACARAYANAATRPTRRAKGKR